MQVKEHNRKVSVTQDRAARDEMVRKARKEYEKPCKGMVEFIDAQGGWISFCERAFPGDPISTYRIDHSEIVTIPLGLAKRLNNSKTKIRQMNMNADGKEVKRYTSVSRIRFTPMDVL